MFPILSRNQIKFIRALKQKKYRYKFKNYLVEGTKLITDIAKHTPETIHYLVIQDDFDIALSGHDFKIFKTIPSVFQSLSEMIHPQGIMAVCHIPDEYFNARWKEKGMALYFDGVQDPGNAGTMLRVADWYGVNHILTGPGTVDLYSAKVVQAAMGSHSYIHIYQCDHRQLSQINCPVLIADMTGQNAYEFEWPENALLVMGNEGQGVSQIAQQSYSDQITLPSAQGVHTESLNVSMACTALLTLRQSYLIREL